MKKPLSILPLLLAGMLCACTPAPSQSTTLPSFTETTLPSETTQLPAETTQPPAQTPAAGELTAEEQLQQIAANRDLWLFDLEPDSASAWFFAVTDLDHNGQLELLSTTCQGTGHFSQNRIWEVGADGLTEGIQSLTMEESKADLSFQDEAVCYFDQGTGLYHYIFTDLLKVGAPEYHYSVRSIIFSQGELFDQTLATKSELYQENGTTEITCQDAEGNTISQEAYDSAAADSYAGLPSHTVSLGWLDSTEVDLFNLDEAALTQLLSESYQTFAAE